MQILKSDETNELESFETEPGIVISHGIAGPALF